MARINILCLISMLLTGCLATKAVTTTAGVATKAAILTVKTTAKVATGAADAIIPGDSDEDAAIEKTDE